MYKMLSKIKTFEDMSELSYEDITELSLDIRGFLIENISKTGGHLASNLGVVELTIALYRVFNLNRDKVLWDVGHQSYVHKILTGRQDGFQTLRQFEGMSGFLKKNESKYDCFEAGHSSTSISAAVGFSRARDLKGEKHDVVAVIGDGALTGGMAFEALNDIGFRKSKAIIILNDNEMSIAKNVGSMSNILNDLRVDPKYNTIKRHVKTSLEKIPYIGDKISDGIGSMKKAVKQVVIPRMIFEDMGLHYFGPIDGHDVRHLEEILKDAKKIDGPVIIHVITKKGKGYKPAENRPNEFHGVGPFDVSSGKGIKKSSMNYSTAVGDAMCELAIEDKEIVCITAAMPKGTGLSEFSRRFPGRFFDVGIAEQHAVTMAAGMATEGLKPFFAVYSTFLQRAYDQVLHDVALQNVPVVFGVDRAGIVGDDGETHQGVFDISFLSQIPNVNIVAPKKMSEVKKILEWAFESGEPTAIRYPRGGDYEIMNDIKDIDVIKKGKWEIIKEGKDVVIVASGRLIGKTLEAAKILQERGIECCVINGVFIKPLDTDMLNEIAKSGRMLVTVEDNIKRGGFGEGILSYLNQENKDIKILNIAFPDEFIQHGNIELLYDKHGLSSDKIANNIDEKFRR